MATREGVGDGRVDEVAVQRKKAADALRGNASGTGRSRVRRSDL
jgi:hypothetical protein